MCYKDSVGVPVKNGDEVAIGNSKGWIIKFIECYSLATEVFLEHKTSHKVRSVLLYQITKI